MSTLDRNTHYRNNAVRRTTTSAPQPMPDLASFPPSDLPTAAAWGRRRKSRSPDSKTSQRNASGHRSDVPGPVKRKKSGPVPNTSVLLAAETDAPDRGRRIKSRPATTLSRLNPSTENVAVASGSTNQRSGHTVVKEKLKPKEKEQEKGHVRPLDTHHSSRNHTPFEPTLADKKVSAQDGVQSEYSGPIASAEFKRIQTELDSLRKIVREREKAMKNQAKTLEELTKELETRTKALKEKDSRLQKLKSKSKKADEIVNNIETNMQCQICLELLLKPFALPPCGHVLCLRCLQEWFRKAPADDDDMYDGDDSDYLLYRRKTCPCCRTVVSSRPIPVFILKNIATTLAKAKNLPLSHSRSRSARTSSPPDDDPWAGLFPPIEDEAYDEDEDQDEDDEEDDEDDWGMNIFEYGSGSEDEPYDGEYVPAQWEPANVRPSQNPYASENPDLTMLRRGVTYEMIVNYQMEYTHEEGLSAMIEDVNGRSRVFLGWNIALSADDITGEEYLNWVISDIASRPERWEVTDIEGGGGTWEARRLMPCEDVMEYDTTDSENWIDEDDLD